MLRKDSKAQATFVFIFLIAGVLVLLVSAIIAPMMVRFNTVMYEAGDNILADSQDDLSAISDVTVRNQINASINEARAATQTNINVGTDLFQYSWIFLLAIIGIVIYLFARQTIEFSSRGGVF